MSTFTMDTGTSRATPSPVPGKRMTAPSIRARKLEGKTEQPIVMLTAYTMRMAQLLDPHCDMLLVGDSLGQVIYGLPSTIPVTMEMMCAHGAAVVRGCRFNVTSIEKSTPVIRAISRTSSWIGLPSVTPQVAQG